MRWYKDWKTKKSDTAIALEQFSNIYKDLNKILKTQMETVFLDGFLEDYDRSRRKYRLDVETFKQSLDFSSLDLEMVTERRKDLRENIGFLGSFFGDFLAALSYWLPKLGELSHGEANSLRRRMLVIVELSKRIDGFNRNVLSERILRINKENQKQFSASTHSLIEEFAWMFRR